MLGCQPKYTVPVHSRVSFYLQVATTQRTRSFLCRGAAFRTHPLENPGAEVGQVKRPGWHRDTPQATTGGHTYLILVLPKCVETGALVSVFVG